MQLKAMCLVQSSICSSSSSDYWWMANTYMSKELLNRSLKSYLRNSDCCLIMLFQCPNVHYHVISQLKVQPEYVFMN